jgi:hypothetical protein
MTQSHRYPNLFIVGAPKSGTTAMARHLMSHTEIYTPLQKEFTFFGKDLVRYAEFVNEKSYLDWYKDWKFEPYALDASPTYLYSMTAPYEFLEKSPDSKIIIMLRNPIEVAYSMYFEALLSGREDQVSFESAWSLEQKRIKGQNIPKNARLEYTTRYQSLGMYSKHINHYIEVFGRKNVHIILFDDFKNDNKTCYEELLTFLNLPYIYPQEFKIHNPTTTARFTSITHFATSPPRWLGKLGGLFLSKSVRWQIRNFIKQKNLKKIKKPDIAKATKEQLIEHYSEEIDKLSNLIGRNLSHWKH